MRWTPKDHFPSKWHRWFAWRPVTASLCTAPLPPIIDNAGTQRVWLEYVVRRFVGDVTPEYRVIAKRTSSIWDGRGT